MSSDTVLRVQGVSKRFGGLQALSDVGITIQRGQVYGLIGPNGAGKTRRASTCRPTRRPVRWRCAKTPSTPDGPRRRMS